LANSGSLGGYIAVCLNCASRFTEPDDQAVGAKLWHNAPIMRLYEGPVAAFNEAVLENKIADQIASNYERYYKRAVNESEFRAWQQSLGFLRNALEVSSLRDNCLIVEYELPYSTRRIDVLIFGRGIEKHDGVVLIELKQWSNESVEDCPTEGNVYVDYGRYRKEQAHPSLQVQGYHFDLIDFLTVFGDEPKISLDSCAYCHNYSREGSSPVLFFPKFKKEIDAFPVFAKEDVRKLGAYLRQRLCEGNGLEVFGRFRYESHPTIQEAARTHQRHDQKTADLQFDR
jgi:uncharacterized protein